jgi:pilus assembly protein CpaB
MGRLRGFLWLTAGLVVALLAGFVGFMTLSRATARAGGQVEAIPTQSVVVAAHAVPIRTLLTSDDLEIRQFPADAVPEGAIARVDDVVGWLSLVDLSAGEPVLTQRLLDPNTVSTDARSALFLAENQVLMAIPADDLLSQQDVLKAGDHVDLVISLDFPVSRDMSDISLPATTDAATATQPEDETSTFTVLQNVSIAAMVYPAGHEEGDGQKAEALLLTLAPQDALVLKYVRDSGGILDVLLRAPDVDQTFDSEPVDLDYVINRYRIPYEQGR